MSRTSTPSRTAASALRRRQSPAPEAVRLDTALPPILSILVGLSLSWIAVGFLETSYRLLDDSALTFQISALAMAVVFAFGLRQPYRAALWAGPIVQRILEPFAGAGQAHPKHPRGTDQRRWLLAGGGALVAGLAALVQPAASSLAVEALDWATANFCWMTPTRIAVEAVVILCLAFVPFTCAGLLVRCVHHTWILDDVASVHRWSWMLTGAAAGFGVLAFAWEGPALPDTLFRTAAIALLAAAILAVARTAPDRVRSRPSLTRRRSPGSGTQPPSPESLVSRTEPQEPDIHDPYPAMLRLGVGIAAGCAIVAGLNWAHVQAASHGGFARASMLAGGAALAAFACGVAIAGRRRRDADHRIGSFGAQCAWIGAGIAAGTSLFAVVSRQSYAPFRETPGHALLWLVCAALPLAALGHAVGYGVIAIGRRITPDDGGICRFGQKIVVGAGAAAAVVAAPLLVHFGSYVSLVAAALALLGCGGILIIHDPAYHASRRRRHVAAVFAAVFCMTALMPVAGRGWLIGRRSAGNILECWSGVYVRGPDGRLQVLNANPRPTTAGAESLPPMELLDWSTFAERPRVCIVSHHDAAGALPIPRAGSRRRFALDQAAHAASTILHGARPERVQPFRALRSSRDRFDLIVVSLIDVSPVAAGRFLSPVRLRQLASRLVSDGAVVVLTRREASFSPDAIQLSAMHVGGRPIHLESTEVSFAGRACRAIIASHKPQALAGVIGVGESLTRRRERGSPIAKRSNREAVGVVSRIADRDPKR